MYRISPFTPIFFNPSSDAYGRRCRYTQLFAKTDHILLEIIATDETSAPTCTINNLVTQTSSNVTLGVWVINSSTTLYFFEFVSLDSSYYSVTVEGVESEIFKITEDTDELALTTLIQYSMKDNRQRTDGVFFIDSVHYFFDFRAPGGFKDDKWSFGVENDKYETSGRDVIDVYSEEYTSKSFTMGIGIGCPIWFAALLNRLLSCTYVYFDTVRYCRKDQSVPEIENVNEGLKSYVFTQQLRRILNWNVNIENENKILIRRVDDSVNRTAESGTDTNIRLVTE